MPEGLDHRDAVKRPTWLVTLILTAALTVGGCSHQSEYIPVLFDHDGATDDYIALLMLVGSGCCDLRGVTVSYGLGHRDAAVEVSGLLLAAMGLDTPVAGHVPSLRGPNSFPDDWRDMSDHVRALPMLQNLEVPPPRSDAVALLIQTLDDSDRPVTVVATGPLTNIAAVLGQRPDLITRIEHLVVMGGALHAPGNVQQPDASQEPATAEYNFFVDPDAADNIMALAATGLDITIAPLDVTNQLPLTPDWLGQLRNDNTLGSQLAAGILGVVEIQIDQGRYYLWDGAAVLALLSPDSLRFKTHAFRVTESGSREGTLQVADDRSGQVNIATGVTDGYQPMERAASWITGVPQVR